MLLSGNSSILWNLEADLDTLTQTYLVPDWSGFLKLESLATLTTPESNLILYFPRITLHKLKGIRRQPGSRGQKARALISEIKQLIRNRNRKILIQSTIEEDHITSNANGNTLTSEDQVISSAIFLRQSGKSVKVMTNSQSMKNKVQSSSNDLELFQPQDLDIPHEPQNVENAGLTDVELGQSKSIENFDPIICMKIYLFFSTRIFRN